MREGWDKIPLKVQRTDSQQCSSVVFTVLPVVLARAWRHMPFHIFNCSRNKWGKSKILIACWPLGSSHYRAEQVPQNFAHRPTPLQQCLTSQAASYLLRTGTKVSKTASKEYTFQDKTELQATYF